MWVLIGIVALVVLVGPWAVVSPGSPGRDYRNKRDSESAGWRSGGNVSWFKDTDRRDRSGPRRHPRPPTLARPQRTSRVRA